MGTRLSVKDGKLMEGDNDTISDNTYRVTISRHENPDIELTGHYWEIIEFNKVGEMKRLI
jgi:hypothetical protein